MKKIIFVLLGLCMLGSVQAQDNDVFTVDINVFSKKVEKIVLAINSLSCREKKKMNADKTKKYYFINNSKYGLDLPRNGEGLLTVKGEVVYQYSFTTSNFEVMSAYLYSYEKDGTTYLIPEEAKNYRSDGTYFRSFEEGLDVNKPLKLLDINPELVNQNY